MATRRHVQYSVLAGEDSDDENGSAGKEDLRFSYNPCALDRVPWKSIALALFLLALGSILLLLSFFILTGHMEGDRSQAYGLLVLGILSFLPALPHLPNQQLQPNPLQIKHFNCKDAKEGKWKVCGSKRACNRKQLRKKRHLSRNEETVEGTSPSTSLSFLDSSSQNCKHIATTSPALLAGEISSGQCSLRNPRGRC